MNDADDFRSVFQGAAAEWIDYESGLPYGHPDRHKEPDSEPPSVEDADECKERRVFGGCDREENEEFERLRSGLTT